MRRDLSPALLWRFTLVLVVCGLISIIGTYGYVIVLKIEEMGVVSDKIQTSGYVPAYNLIWLAFQISFHRLGLLLLVPGLLLLALRRRALPFGGPELVLAWLGVLFVFLGIEMATALQVRYIYFVAPLACLLIALPLAAWAQRGRVGWAAAWGIVLLLLVQGALLWKQSALEDVMMSMSPLLR
jgi:hypothetical protein